EDEVHIAADGAAAGLQLLGGAGADEGDAAGGVLLLLETGGEDHGGQSHGNIVGELGEELLGHDGPGGAAGGGHEGLVLWHLPHEVLGLLDGAEIRTHRHLCHAGKAQALHGGGEPLGGSLGAKLSQEGGGHDGNNLVPPLDSVDQL